MSAEVVDIGTKLHNDYFCRSRGTSIEVESCVEEVLNIAELCSIFVLDVLRGGLVVAEGSTKYISITFSRCCTFNNIAKMSSRRGGEDSMGIESLVDIGAVGSSTEGDDTAFEVFLLNVFVANSAAKRGGI